MKYFKGECVVRHTLIETALKLIPHEEDTVEYYTIIESLRNLNNQSLKQIINLQSTHRPLSFLGLRENNLI